MNNTHKCDKESEIAILKTNDTFIMEEIKEIKEQGKETNNKLDLVLEEVRNVEVRTKKRCDETKASIATQKALVWGLFVVGAAILGATTTFIIKGIGEYM